MHFKTFWGQKLKFPMAVEDQGHMGRGGGGGGGRAKSLSEDEATAAVIQCRPRERLTINLATQRKWLEVQIAGSVEKRQPYSFSTPVSTPVTHHGAGFPQFSREKV